MRELLSGNTVEGIYSVMQAVASSSSIGAETVVSSARNMLFHAEVARRHAGTKPDYREDRLDLDEVGSVTYALKYASRLRGELQEMIDNHETNLPLQATIIMNTLMASYAERFREVIE